jgi:hypothetical protein
MRTFMAMVPLCLVQGSTRLPALTLVEKGQPSAVIAVRRGGPTVTAFAAQEMQRYLRRISGATLPVVEITDEPSPGEPAVDKATNVIAVGSSAWTRSLGLTCDQMLPDSVG